MTPSRPPTDDPSASKRPPRRGRVATWTLRGLAVGFIAVLAVLGWFGPRYLRAASVLARASHHDGWIARRFVEPIASFDVSLPAAGGDLRARVYRPVGSSPQHPRRGVVLLHGVHHEGIDDARVRQLATEFARSGLVVLTPEIPSLTHYRIERACVDQVRAAARWLSTQPEVLRDGVGIWGASFAGGIALVAAASPSMRGRIAYVVAVGAHHDLHVVIDLVARGVLPDGTRVEPYALAALFSTYPEPFVEHDQVLAFRRALFELMDFQPDVSSRTTSKLHGRARALMDALITSDAAALAPTVHRALVLYHDELAYLSPATHVGELPDIPVFLVHGRHDTVVPAEESLANAQDLAPVAHVRVLITPLLDHVGVLHDPSLWDQWLVVRMVGDILSR